MFCRQEGRNEIFSLPDFSRSVAVFALFAVCLHAQTLRCDLASKDTVINGQSAKRCLDLDSLKGKTVVVPSNVTRLDNDGFALCRKAVVSGGNADIVFILDQSGSMWANQAWINTGVTPNDTLYYTGTGGCNSTTTSGTVTIPVIETARSVPKLNSGTGCNQYAGDPLNARGAAVRQAIDYIAANSTVSTVGYLGFAASVSQVRRPLQMSSSSNVTTVKGSVVLTNSSGTTYRGPLDTAKRWLNDTSLRKNPKAAIVFISDGANTGASYSDLINALMPPIYGIFLGKNATADTANLVQLANQTGGAYYRVPPTKPDSLASVVRIILNRILQNYDPDLMTITNSTLSPAQTSTANLAGQFVDQGNSSWRVTLDSSLALQASTANAIRVITRFKEAGTNSLRLDTSQFSLSTTGTVATGTSTVFSGIVTQCYAPSELRWLNVAGSRPNPLYFTEADSSIKLQLRGSNSGLTAVRPTLSTLQSVGRTPDAETGSLSLAFSSQDSSRFSGTVTMRPAATPNLNSGVLEPYFTDSLIASWVNPRDPRDFARDTLRVRVANKAARAYFSTRSDGGDTATQFVSASTQACLIVVDNRKTLADSLYRVNISDTTGSSDHETYALNEIAPGKFSVCFPIESGTKVDNNGRVQYSPVGDQLRAVYVDPVSDYHDTAIASVVIKTAPAILYNPATVIDTVGKAASHSVSTAGGGIATVYHIAPALPAGLSLDTLSGFISGMPSVVSTSASYTITAAGPGGTGTTGLTLSVVVAKPVIAYNPSVVVDTVGGAVSHSAVSSGGPIASCSVTSGAMPAGFILDNSCRVLGTSSVTFSAAQIVVTALNASGSDTAALTLSVVVAKPIVEYNPSAVVDTVGMFAAHLVLTSGGPITSCPIISGALPSGYGVDTACNMSGIPTATFDPVALVFMASNASGTDTAKLLLSAVVAKPVIGYNPAAVVDTVSMGASHGVVSTGGPITSCSVTYGSLPVGFSIDSACLVKGTPVTPFAATTVIVTALNASGSDTAALTLSAVVARPVIGYNPSSVVDTVGVTANHSIASSGGPIVSCSVTSGALPSGFGIDNACLVTGIPAGTFGPAPIVVTATNTSGSDTAVLMLSAVVAPPTIAYNPSTVIDTVGQQVSHAVVSSNGPISSCAVTSGSLPAGFSIDNGCLVTGTPSTPFAPVTIVVTASNSSGGDTATLTLSAVIDRPVIAYIPSVVVDTVGQQVSHAVVSSNGPISSCAVTSGSLPTGFGISDGCLVTGTLVAPFNPVTVIVTAVNSSGSDTAVLTLSAVVAKPVIGYNPSSVVDTVGQAISHAVISSGGPITSCSVTSGSLPSGLSLDNVCVVTGIPTGTFGPVSIVVTAMNASGIDTAVLTLSAVVAKPMIGYNPSSVVDTVGQVISHSVISSGGPISTCSVTSGTLPSGFSVDNGCVVTGTPVATYGPTTVTVTAVNSSGSGTATLALSAVVARPIVSYNPPAVIDTAGVSATHSAITSGGPIASCSVTFGTLPSGYAIDNACKISGTPVVAFGSTSVVVMAVNASGSDTAVLTLSAAVARPTVSFNPSAVVDTVGQAVSHAMVSSGGPINSCQVTSGTLPSGYSIGTACSVSGTPSTTFGPATVVVTAVNTSGSDTATLTLSGVVAKPVIGYNPSTFVDTVGVVASHSVVSSGGPITSCSVTSGTLPAGFAIDNGCRVNGNATSPFIASSLVVTASNSSGSDTAKLTLSAVVARLVVSYRPSVVVDTIGIPAIHELIVLGGPVTDCQLTSGILPGAYSLSNTCTISGTTAEPFAAAELVVTATGPGGTDTANLTLLSADAKPAITFNPSSVRDTVGKPANHPAIFLGGPVIACTVTAGVLPSGLVIDNQCNISGTPTVPAGPVSLTVTATNGVDQSSASLSIEVIGEPSSIAYSRPSIVAIRNVAIDPDTVTFVGAPMNTFTINPALPAGLNLNPSNGLINGTPTVVSALTNYVVTGSGPGGTDTAWINIRVVSPPANLSYADELTTYVVGVAVTPNTPSITGYATRYSVAPPLPNGLRIDSLSGVIAGTPVLQSFPSDYTVTAGSFAGSTTSTLNIAVVGTPSNLSYTDDLPTYKAGVAIIPPNMPNVHGIVTFYTVSPTLPDGIVLDQTTGYILGTPTTESTPRVYTITGNNPGGTVSTMVTLGVVP